MIRQEVEDAAYRLAENEWLWIQREYPNVAFNITQRQSAGIEPVEQKHLVVCEPATMCPWLHDIDIIKRFDTYITYNEKIHVLAKEQGVNSLLMDGVPTFNRYIWPDRYLSWDQRKNALLIMQKFYRMYADGDFTQVRFDACEKLHFPIEVWSQTSAPSLNVRNFGPAHPTAHHSSQAHIDKLGEYRFCFCPESTYHQLHSWGFITERLFNCFKARTLAIYQGCYNIHEFVPNGLYIDLRDYQIGPEVFDWSRLSNDLHNFSQTQWEDMVEAAHEWQELNDVGAIKPIERMIRDLL
jgi:hypothetical protein